MPCHYAVGYNPRAAGVAKWQTQRTQNPPGKPVGVRISPSAPSEETPRYTEGFLYLDTLLVTSWSHELMTRPLPPWSPMHQARPQRHAASVD